MTLTIPLAAYQALTNERGETVTSAIRADDGGLITRIAGVTLGQPVLDEETASFSHSFDSEGVQLVLERVSGARVDPPLESEGGVMPP